MADKAFTIQDTTATRKIFRLRKRIRAVAGGTSASKTVSILTWCIDYCQVKQSRKKRVSVVSESYPHLENGAMLDFETIMKDRGYWDDNRWHGTKHIYTFETGHEIQFFSPDTYGKAHGPRRDVLFLNEANNLEYPIVIQLILRTREIVWMDWNPSSEFWYYTEPRFKDNDVDFITLTYLDNEALDEEQIKEIERLKSNPQLWKVYGLGQLGEVQGRVYTDWQFIDEIPHEARLEGYGLDFGYRPDPAAMAAIYYYNGGYILDEVLYQKGLLNSDLATHIKNLPEKLIIADNAEPKSIAELRSYGISIMPTTKGADSIRFGVRVVQDQRISVTRRSLNLIKEYRNYMHAQDDSGAFIFDKYVGPDHLLDAVRYKMTSIVPIIRKNEYLDTLPRPTRKKPDNIAV